VGDEGFSEHLRSHGFGLVGVINEVNATLEAGLFEVTETAASTEDLRLDDAAAIDVAGNFMSIVRAEGNASDRDWHLEGVEEGTGLILVQLQTTHGQGTVFEEGSIS